MLIKVITMIICLCSGGLLLAQKTITLKNAPAKAVSYYEKGQKALQEQQSERAIAMFASALEVAPNFIDAQMMWAGVHSALGHDKIAEEGLEKVIDADPTFEPRVFYEVGICEWNLNKFEESAQHIESYLATKPTNVKLKREAERLLANAAFSAIAIKNPVPYTLTSLGGGINTPADEYLPSLTADASMLVFTRRDNEYDENFYASLSDTAGRWTKAYPIDAVNTSDNEGAEAISADGSWLVFTACNRKDDNSQGNCDLYWSQQKGDTWTKPQPFSATINSKAWDAQPCISADGKFLFFSSERPGGQGGRDLWVANREKGGKWALPTNLGAAVNSPYDEQCPFIHPDGQTLYFTSNGLPGMGNNDLYFSRKNADGTWSKAQNLGYPINTKGHEGTLVVSLDGKTAYFAAVKPEGLGKNDIYKFPLPAFARPKPITYVKAKVTDAATRNALVAKVEFVDLATGQIFVTASTKTDGTFLVCLPAGKDYALNVSKKNYLFASENFNLIDTLTSNKPFLLNIALIEIAAKSETINTSTTPEPPKLAKPIVLRNVFFETGAAKLLPASYGELDRLAALMKETPTLRLQFNGHTDDVGDEKSNLILSENRAKTVYDYLLSQGIAHERLRYKGFGESLPIADNVTFEGKAKNRRTEFEIY
jgi:outer membrane protein OmpA-like peptidoglycan-associated protein/Tol biopolymer transport system component